MLLAKRLLVALIILASGFKGLLSQEMLGLSGGNFAGVHGVGINPSSITGTKLYMDYNLITVSSANENNYAFWAFNDLRNFLREGELPTYYTLVGEKRNFDIYRDNKIRSGFAMERISGPSGMWVIGKHALAFNTGFRSYASFGSLPYDAALFLYEGLDYWPLQQILFSHSRKMPVASLQWIEAGLTYAYNFHRYKWNSWSAGITLKPLFGVSAFYVFVDNADYLVHNDDSASVYHADFRYGYSVPFDNETMEKIVWPPFFKGYGFAIDAGLTFWKTTHGHSSMFFSRICEPRFEQYKYKIGISLTDLGFISFSNQAESFDYKNASTEYYDPWDTLPGGTIDELKTKVEYYFPQAIFNPEIQNSFTMNLPTALNIQADYHIQRALYILATITQQIPLSKNSIYRPSVLAITPRYETANFEVGFPVSFIDYRFGKPYIGFGLRYGMLFFGADDFLKLTGLTDISGFNLYAGIRMNLSNTFKMNFIKGLCDPIRHKNIQIFDYRNF